ncbi:helix-turn-helix transcriptional regulator [Parahaliea aestuarii]|uniref:Helix-turn-helix transcriptional regulator n=1 Tax=Parahaliea aestuarii TaxID=1852021 RepID=A0A5C8ZPT9_9GAMM|nr:helix-turn-helix transcriptional regulator [Parahaliea aestuarii]TXS90458.1 helix-turn-helix transcriptional regulator [Parahaliea aestuarii]
MNPQFVRVVETLYESTFEPGQLEVFLEEMAELTDSAAAGIYCCDDNTRHSGFVSSIGISAGELTAREREAGFHREVGRHMSPPPRSGSITYTQDLLPGKRLHRERLFSHFLQPQGLEQAGCLYVEHGGHHTVTASFMRKTGRGKYREQDKALFSKVMPHLQRSFRLKRHTAGLPLGLSSAWELMDMLSYGVILFNSRQEVIYLNPQAERIVADNDGVVLNTRYLGACRSGESQQLRNLLRATIASTIDPAVPLGGGDLLVSRPSGKRAYSVMIHPLTPSVFSDDQCPAAAVILQDPEQASEAPLARMRSLYDLTTAESRVANEIMQGHSLEICAQNLGHSVSTSRNLLKRVFAKTETGRQNELVSLLLRSPLGLQSAQT